MGTGIAAKQSDKNIAATESSPQIPFTTIEIHSVFRPEYDFMAIGANTLGNIHNIDIGWCDGCAMARISPLALKKITKSQLRILATRIVQLPLTPRLNRLPLLQGFQQQIIQFSITLVHTLRIFRLALVEIRVVHLFGQGFLLGFQHRDQLR